MGNDQDMDSILVQPSQDAGSSLRALLPMTNWVVRCRRTPPQSGHPAAPPNVGLLGCRVGRRALRFREGHGLGTDVMRAYTVEITPLSTLLSSFSW